MCFWSNKHLGTKSMLTNAWRKFRVQTTVECWWERQFLCIGGLSSPTNVSSLEMLLCIFVVLAYLFFNCKNVESSVRISGLLCARAITLGCMLMKASFWNMLFTVSVARNREHVGLCAVSYSFCLSHFCWYIGQCKSNVTSEPCVWNRAWTFVNGLKNNTVATTLVYTLCLKLI